MKAFWALAARAWPADLPLQAWASRCPGLPLSELEGDGVLIRRALRPFERVECGTCGGVAQVAWELGAMVGVCQGDLDCPSTPMGADAVALRVDEAGLLRRVAESLELVGASVFGEPLMSLGRRRIGDEWVNFAFCRRPGAERVLAELLGQGGGGVRVILAPSAGRIPASLPDQVGGAVVLWVGLDEVVRLSPTWAVSLDAVTSRHRFAGWTAPRRAGVVIGADGVMSDGVAISLSPLALRLLQELARAPGTVRSRAALALSLWPDEHTRSGALARGVNPDDVDRRLRNLVAELRAQLGTERIVNRRGPSDVGGYGLAADAGHVCAA